MAITPRLMKKRKKSKVLGNPIEIQDRSTYEDLDLDAKVELIRALIPIGLERVSELLDENVKQQAGERYQRQDPSKLASRYGSNRGSASLYKLALGMPPFDLAQRSEKIDALSGRTVLISVPAEQLNRLSKFIMPSGERNATVYHQTTGE